MVHRLDSRSNQQTSSSEHGSEQPSTFIDRRASDADYMLTDELEAIRAIEQALTRLPDRAARKRVLRWATERFDVDTTAAVVAPAAQLNTSTVAAIDQTLSTDGLHELFPAGSKSSCEELSMY